MRSEEPWRPSSRGLDEVPRCERGVTRWLIRRDLSHKRVALRAPAEVPFQSHLASGQVESIIERCEAPAPTGAGTFATLSK
jgi:hypothetical protein